MERIILHITNDFSGSSVYMNLIKELDKLGVKQIVYTPIKSANSIGKNNIQLKTEKSKIIYSDILNLHLDRIFYRRKIKKVMKDIESKVNMSEIKFIHSHTWYSDGGVAFLLEKKYNIPYITTIRNSDINVFYRYLLHERSFGKKILRSSKEIILISASYENRVKRLSALEPMKQELNDKIKILPNGVDPFWIENSVCKIKNEPFKATDSNIDVLFIGKFAPGKRIVELMEAIIQLSNEHSKILKLHIVGGDGSETNKVEKLLRDNPNLFKYYGKVYDKNNLLEIIRGCDIYAMPSRSETFGLVYIETMLQGLPILYTKDEGIDGFYLETIGEKVSKEANVNEIKEKLRELINNLPNYSIPIEKIKKNHNWRLIAEEYKIIYQRQILCK